MTETYSMNEFKKPTVSEENILPLWGITCPNNTVSYCHVDFCIIFWKITTVFHHFPEIKKSYT